MILQKLKEATAEQHKNLENVVNVMDRMFTLTDYGNLLVKFYRFYSSIEPKLAAIDWAPVGYDFEERQKTPKIKRDLEKLGLFSDDVANTGWSTLPEFDSHAEGFGSLYVLEGATLGGQIIKRHLETHLGLTPENGGEFFAGYGADTGKMWKEFCAIVTEYSEKNDSDDRIVETAKETFDSFRACFKESDQRQQANSSV